jgi:DNA-binding transcriptional MerR regulator
MGIGKNIDKEWIYLLIQAKQLGITIEEIRTFLRQESLENVSHLESQNDIPNEKMNSNFLSKRFEN